MAVRTTDAGKSAAGIAAVEAALDHLLDKSISCAISWSRSLIKTPLCGPFENDLAAARPKEHSPYSRSTGLII